MKKPYIVAVFLVCLSALVVFGQSNRKKAAATPSPSPSDALEWEMFDQVKWQKGPSLGDLGSTAQVKVPDGYVFAGPDDTRTIMETLHNPKTGRELGFVAPNKEGWFAVFEYDDVGYVKDDEKDSLDADALLESIRKGTEASNEERRKRGWATMTILGWEQPPRYNETTHNLEWAIRGVSDGEPVINYNTRMLGRGGVMEVTLVTDAASLQTTLPKFKTMLAGFDFNQGQKYAEFRAGDKMAAYGLTGLIVGGGTAALVKTGAFKWLWKAGIAVLAAVAALLKKIFSREKTA